MPTYEEVYAEDMGKRRHYQRLLDAGKGAGGEGAAMWGVIIGALVFLWLVRRSFRGVSTTGLLTGG